MNARTETSQNDFLAEVSHLLRMLLEGDGRYYVRKGKLQKLVPECTWGKGYMGVVVRTKDSKNTRLITTWIASDGKIGGDFRTAPGHLDPKNKDPIPLDSWCVDPRDKGSTPRVYLKGYALALLRQ